MKNVIIYSSMFCGYCHRAKALLKQRNIPFKDISVDMDPAARAEMREKAGGRNTVPQIFSDGTHIGGCDELYALDAKQPLTLDD